MDAFCLVVRTVYLDSLRNLVFGKASRKTTFKGRSHKTTNRFGIRTRHPQFLKSMSKGIVNPDRTVNEGSIQIEKDSCDRGHGFSYLISLFSEDFFL